MYLARLKFVLQRCGRFAELLLEAYGVNLLSIVFAMPQPPMSLALLASVYVLRIQGSPIITKKGDP